MTAATLMLQGTGSDVGKSLLVAGLCRLFTRRGARVRPFKPQNMSNNAAVTADGGEIGRAQALQARACGIRPTTDMNPVLLKPQTEIGAQIVVNGRVRGNASARDYHTLRSELLPEVLSAFQRLREQADLVLIEGAGSPAEINLRAGDIANMGFAEPASVPVVLVGDIARGGVIASIFGTWAVLTPHERALLKGYIVNKFRGDRTLFDDGTTAITERTGLMNFGVVPYFADAHRLPAEDAVALEQRAATGDQPIRVAVPQLSRIANFDDLDPLAAEPDVDVHFVPQGQAIPVADLIIIPGTKATLHDLAMLREQGWDVDIRAHVRRGGRVLGICGGYQILGRYVRDPHGIEGEPGDASGLGLLDIETELTSSKTLEAVAGTVDGQAVQGYEMHVGRTSGSDADNRPMVRFKNGRTDGAISPQGNVMGCYVHGLFAVNAFRSHFLSTLRCGRPTQALDYEASIDQTLDALADHLATTLKVDDLWKTAQLAKSNGSA